MTRRQPPRAGRGLVELRLTVRIGGAKPIIIEHEVRFTTDEPRAEIERALDVAFRDLREEASEQTGGRS